MFNQDKFDFRFSKLQQGVALLEALIAILIFSMGILAIAGLQGYMLKGATDAKSRADASFIAQQQLALMWANPQNLAGFAEVDTPVSALPNGRRTTDVVDVVAGLVTVTVTWQVPGENPHQYIVDGQVTGCNLSC
ncbi:MAG: prepilin-type cleavage/methylation domain-containing protein [Methylotenera sp.]|nr:prepilin-type cleavage/methylation domain-containing protein [Methylotenera sp.]